MNWKTFFALLSRDGHVARRNLLPTLLQNLLQPLLFTFVFGKVMTSSGMMPAAYKSVLLPGVMAISMVLAGVQAVAMPLITEFQFTREIEDRLLAPIEIGWLAVEKIVAGMIQAMVAGLVVIPAAWLIMGSGVKLDFGRPFEFLLVALLVALFSSAGGLALGCSVGQTQIGLMFSLVLAERAEFVPHFAGGGTGEPTGICQRGIARGAGPAGVAYKYDDRDWRAGGDRYRSAVSGPKKVSPEGSELASATAAS